MSQIRLDLATLAHLGGPDLENAVERLVDPFELALRARFLEALTVMAAELTVDIESGRIETRLDGDTVSLAYLPDTEVVTGTNQELDARVTLRMPESLKSRMESVAAADRVSVNTWLLRLIELRSAGQAHSRRQLRGHGKG